MTSEKQSDIEGRPQRARLRSPNYPAIGLREAVERVRRLYEADGKVGAPLEATLKHLGFSSAHGHARTTISALRKFGLVEDRGGRIAPSKRAVDILTFPEDHPRHVEALRSAALEPTVYAQLVERFKEDGRLPSDVSLKPELIADKGFNRKSVDGLLAAFRSTLEYAGLLDGHTLLLRGLEPGQESEGPEVLRVREELRSGVNDTSLDAEGNPFRTHPPDGNTDARWVVGSAPSNRAVCPEALNILVGFSREGEAIHAQVSFNVPIRKGFLRRLGKQLESLEAGAGLDEYDLGS